MERQTKLTKWRDKTDAEKHRLAISGAIVITVLVMVIWVTSLFNKLGNQNLALVKSATNSSNTSTEKVDPVSPFSSFSQILEDGAFKIKEQFSSVKDTAKSVLTADDNVYVATDTPVVPR